MTHPSASAPRGMVATSHPLAVQAGLEMLRAGGTAVDAAVAAAGVLTVVDPRSIGLGGDAFAMCWKSGATRPAGLAAAGVSPAGLTVEAIRRVGYTTMPVDGPWSITVPGAPAAWQVLLDRFGKLDVERILTPAIRAADEGFVVTPAVAAEWATAARKLQRNEAAARTFLPQGRPPAEGECFAVPELAETLRTFVRDGSDAFYRGSIAERIGAAVEEENGPLRASDLAAWGGPEWVDPISVSFRGLDVYEMPPPGQGLVVLGALKVYQALPIDGIVDQDHASIEAIKVAHDDANRYLADPAVEPVPVEELLSWEHLDEQLRRVSMTSVMTADVGRPSDTAYVAVADADGGACSFIQSLYDGFGSGIAVPGTGLVLHNRASGFRLDDQHPNRPAPRKRPYHTIIPAMLGRGTQFAGCLGVVGGFMQTQGQVQVLRNLVDRGMTPQQACDAPRFRVYRGRQVALEAGYPQDRADGLAARGHEITELDRFERGGAQLILRNDDGFQGGSDARKDGYASGH
jgi:gamma-glutamyltranspeptidase / glutathione hydrolase